MTSWRNGNASDFRPGCSYWFASLAASPVSVIMIPPSRLLCFFFVDGFAWGARCLLRSPVFCFFGRACSRPLVLARPCSLTGSPFAAGGLQLSVHPAVGVLRVSLVVRYQLWTFLTPPQYRVNFGVRMRTGGLRLIWSNPKC